MDYLGYGHVPSGGASVTGVAGYFIAEIGRVVDVGVVAHHGHVKEAEHIYDAITNRSLIITCCSRLSPIKY